MRRVAIDVKGFDEKGLNKYWFSAIKDNGQEVTGDLAFEEIQGLYKKVEGISSIEEQKEDIINQVINEKVIENSGVTEEYKDLVSRWQVGKRYEENNAVLYNGQIFYANKGHEADYESIPTLNEEFWRDEYVKSQKEDEETHEEEKIEPYSRDKTYNPGDKVSYMDKNYACVERVTSDEDLPGESDKWKLIEDK